MLEPWSSRPGMCRAGGIICGWSGQLISVWSRLRTPGRSSACVIGELASPSRSASTDSRVGLPGPQPGRRVVVAAEQHQVRRVLVHVLLLRAAGELLAARRAAARPTADPPRSPAA